jgi:hypothetical protein
MNLINALGSILNDRKPLEDAGSWDEYADMIAQQENLVRFYYLGLLDFIHMHAYTQDEPARHKYFDDLEHAEPLNLV